MYELVGRGLVIWKLFSMFMLEVISIGSGGGDFVYNEIFIKCYLGCMKLF